MHGRVAADSHFDFLSERIVGNGRDCLLRAHAAYDLCPIAFDALLPQLEADGIHDPVGQETEEQVGVKLALFFVSLKVLSRVTNTPPILASKLRVWLEAGWKEPKGWLKGLSF